MKTKFFLVRNRIFPPRKCIYKWEAWEWKRQWHHISPLFPGNDNKHPYSKATFKLHLYKSTGFINCLLSSHHRHTSLFLSPPATSNLTQLVYVGLLTLSEQQLLSVHGKEVIQHDRPQIWQNLSTRTWIWETHVLPKAIKHGSRITQELKMYKEAK